MEEEKKQEQKEKKQQQKEKKQQQSRRRRRKRRSKEQEEEKMEMGRQFNFQTTEAPVTGGDQQTRSEEHIVDIPEQPEAAEDSLFSEPMSNYSGWLSFLENFILGPNQRNQIWRLRLLAGLSFYRATRVGLFYLGGLPQAKAPNFYQMVMLITTVGAPIVVAMIGLLVSYWFPNRQNWITGLSVANFIMLCDQAIYWTQKWGTGY